MKVSEITKYCEELSEKVNDEFNIPVKINGRLTRTLGRVSFINGKKCVPTLMEFSRQFLETSTEESIKSVIQHEWGPLLFN